MDLKIFGDKQARRVLDIELRELLLTACQFVGDAGLIIDAAVGYVMLVYPAEVKSESDALRMVAENLMHVTVYFHPSQQQQVIERFDTLYQLAHERAKFRWRIKV